MDTRITGYFPKKAMVLAAGLGKRMRSYDSTVPKPLVRVGGKPLIDWSLDLLEKSGVQEVVVNTCYMADMLEEHLAQRASPAITISREEGEPLETGGGIRKALPLLGEEPFFVLNSDVITLDGTQPLLQRMAQHWNAEEMDGLLLQVPLGQTRGYQGQGDFSLSDEGVLQRRGMRDTVPYVFSGVQLLHPRLFAHTPEGAFSMNRLYDHGASDGVLSRFKGLAHDGAWLHVGDAEGRAQAEEYLASRVSA